uniref:Uncharacterized protein n=1 Tax=Solanum tuberosum TaxID=4113 RepID=M1CZV6_SOLTU
MHFSLSLTRYFRSLRGQDKILYFLFSTLLLVEAVDLVAEPSILSMPILRLVNGS